MLHVLIDRDLITGVDQTVNEGSLGRFLIVDVAGSHRVDLRDQLSVFVEAGVGTVGPLDTDNNTGQENTSGDIGVVALLAVGRHAGHIGLSETVALENGDVREESGELLESFIGKRSGTTQDSVKTREVGLCSGVYP